MIAFLRGVVQAMSGSMVTLDVQGVGYAVRCTRQCIAALATGDQAAMVIHTEMREGAISLYGFADQTEKEVFLLLMCVKGVGARSASDILSFVDKQELLRCIGSSDVTRLQTIKGIGKKTAERIVVELRDRVVEFASAVTPRGLAAEVVAGTAIQEAEEALKALGFTRSDAERALAQIDSALIAAAPSGELVREALRYI